MFRKITCILLLSYAAIGHSQSCHLTLEGTIRDDDNSEELGFAVIKVLPSEKIVQSDALGKFKLDELCSGTYSILIKHAGCRDSIFRVELNRSKKLIFKLPHSLNALKDIEIIAKHADVKYTQSSQTLDQKVMDESRGQNLGDQLKQLNGVSTINTGPTISKPMINGMQGYRILILNNGVRQEGQQWGNDHAPEIDPFIAQKLSVVRGAAAVRYGSDAIGGIVLVEPGDLPDTASLTGEFNLVSMSNGRGGASSLLLQGYFDKLKYFNWRVQGTLKKTGTLKTPTYFLKNTGLEEENFSYALGYHRKKIGLQLYYSQFNSIIGIFSGAHVGNLTDLQAAFNRAKPADSLATFSYKIGRPYQHIEHELIKLSGDIHTGNRSRIYMNYAWQYNIRKEYDKHVARNDSIAALNLPEAVYKLNTQLAEVIWEHDYIKSFRGKFGWQGMLQNNRYEQRFFIPNYDSWSIGFFGTERWVQPMFELEAGIRYDYKYLKSYFYTGKELQQPSRTFDNLSVNIGGIYKLNRFVKLNLNASNGWRAPAPNELYSNGLHHGIGAIERGNPNLQTEKCLSIISTGVVDYKSWHAELSAYYYQFKNYIYYEPGPKPELTIRGAFPVFYYKQNDARISGSDFSLSYSFNKWLTVRGAAMWVRGYNTELNQYLLYMPSDRYQFYMTLKFSDYKHIKNMYLEPNLLFVAKQTRVQPGVDFAEPPPSYALFGINAGSTFLLNKQKIVLVFSITNAANAIYRDYLDRFRYYNDGLGTNYTLRIRIPFVLYDK